LTLLVDSGPLAALADARDPKRDRLLQTLLTERGSLVIPAPITAEVDHLLGERLGEAARRAFLAALASGRFTVACLEREDYVAVATLEARYADLRLGLADCALVVLAHRCETTRIMTFDERHFRAVAPLAGGTFTLLPADE
jgi:uncharacterized protein